MAELRAAEGATAESAEHAYVSPASCPAPLAAYRGSPLPSTGSGCTLHGKKAAPTWHPPPLAGDPCESWARCSCHGR